jgi:phosphohistidine phosphatase
MDLILWRHAEAEDPAPNQPDARRRLTPRGQKQAKKMARWLREHLPKGGKGCRILVSPADRTQQTAVALELPFELEPRIAVGTSVKDHLAVCDWPNNAGPMLLVGHQPTLGRLAAQLLTGQDADWAIRKGAFLWLTCKPTGPNGQTVLRASLEPNLVP